MPTSNSPQAGSLIGAASEFRRILDLCESGLRVLEKSGRLSSRYPRLFQRELEEASGSIRGEVPQRRFQRRSARRPRNPDLLKRNQWEIGFGQTSPQRRSYGERHALSAGTPRRRRSSSSTISS